MHKYTEEDLKTFKRDENGWLICPSGDYSEIKSFGEWCSFGDARSFGEWCSFGDACSFGLACSFGEECRFGKSCRFGESCRFGDGCRLGEDCSFGKRCSFEGLTNAHYVAVDRIGSRLSKAYFFAADEGYFVRAGCWFGTFDEFKARIDEVYPEGKHRRDYLAALELAKIMLEAPKND